MITTWIALMFAGLFVVHCFLWCAALRLGLRWAGAARPSSRRIVAAFGIVVILQTVCIVAAAQLHDLNPSLALAVDAGCVAAAVLVPCVVFMKLFKLTLRRAVLAWLPTFMLGLAMAAIPVLIVSPYLIEAFKIPTNAMAPTILGKHWLGVCKQCGGPAYCSPLPPDAENSDAPLMICPSFHVTHPTNYDKQVHGSDRLAVAKFIQPKRWDLIVFRYPEEPGTLYLFRLVGLPGERIEIKDGKLYANGKSLEPPADLTGLEYADEMRFVGDKIWGNAKKPAQLGDEEYFVLGDFSLQSQDSRLWRQGAQGHNPFAVPKSHLVGVVTTTYWPPSRWRTFR